LFYGFFTDYEVTQGLLGLGDEFTLDLRNLDPKTNSLNSLKLRLGIMSSGLGSNFDFQVLVRKINVVNWTTYNSTVDTNLKKVTDRFIDLNLSGNSAENLFEIKVFPIRLTEAEQVEIFSVLDSRSDSITNTNNLYTLSASVGVSTVSGLNPLEKMDSYPYSDNLSCLEGEVTYTAQPLTVKSENNDNAEQSTPLDNLGSGCGMIDLDDHNGQGPGGSGIMSFLFGIMLFSIFLIIGNQRHNILS